MQGYRIMEYKVVTNDGYILTMHRIANKKINADHLRDIKGRPAILIQHGFLMSSQDWISVGGRGKTKGIPYRLFDAGFDVWLANYRGNSHSREHIYLRPNEQPHFWNFAVKEFAEFDLPAEIEEIQRVKNTQAKVTLFGFSEGTIVSLYGLVEKADYFRDKVKLFVALAPTIYFTHVHNKHLSEVAAWSNLISTALETYSLYEI